MFLKPENGSSRPIRSLQLQPSTFHFFGGLSFSLSTFENEYLFQYFRKVLAHRPDQTDKMNLLKLTLKKLSLFKVLASCALDFQTSGLNKKNFPAKSILKNLAILTFFRKKFKNIGHNYQNFLSKNFYHIFNRPSFSLFGLPCSQFLS